MKALPSFGSVRTTKAYDEFLKTLYGNVKRHVEEIDVPSVRVISVIGRQPPASKPYQDAIAVLYGIAYTLKMGLKFGKLPTPPGYFDYKVGALETFWWSVGKTFDITNAATLRWQAFLMVPAFVTGSLVKKARSQAEAMRPGVSYGTATLATVTEGRSMQVLHVGPYDTERPTIAALLAHVADCGLAVAGRHHEIYLSDPRRTSPEKLRTVIRLAVKPASRKRAPSRA